MKNLIKELENENQKGLKRALDRFENELKENESGITWTEKHFLNRKEPYKRNRILQVKNRLNEIFYKRLKKQLDKIDQINSAFDRLPSDLVLTINFYKSHTWGFCPRGNDNFGHVTTSISGCGYDKESTATAQLLNQNEIILKKLFLAKNKKASAKNSEFLGYGSGYGILPNFEGGVGLSCHVKILENLGYKVTVSGNDKTTILVVSEKCKKGV